MTSSSSTPTPTPTRQGSIDDSGFVLNNPIEAVEKVKQLLREAGWENIISLMINKVGHEVLNATNPNTKKREAFYVKYEYSMFNAAKKMVKGYKGQGAAYTLNSQYVQQVINLDGWIIFARTYQIYGIHVREFLKLALPYSHQITGENIHAIPEESVPVWTPEISKQLLDNKDLMNKIKNRRSAQPANKIMMMECFTCGFGELQDKKRDPKAVDVYDSLAYHTKIWRDHKCEVREADLNTDKAAQILMDHYKAGRRHWT